jgi:hypothetical protein
LWLKYSCRDWGFAQRYSTGPGLNSQPWKKQSSCEITPVLKASNHGFSLVFTWSGWKHRSGNLNVSFGIFHWPSTEALQTQEVSPFAMDVWW